MKVMISARDPGATLNLIEIIGYISKCNDIQMKIIAARPGYDYFLKSGIPVEQCPIDAVRDADDPQSDQLLKWAAKKIDEFIPDVVLTGVSGPDAGIDEALLKAAKSSSIPTCALQDFWGDVNSTFGQPADVYFVFDSQAAELTSVKVHSEAIISGLPKYVTYKNINPFVIRDKVRKKYDIAPEKTIVAFLGQPLHDHEDYYETIKAFSTALQNTLSDAVYIYRPHPKEQNVPLTARLFKDNGIDIEFFEQDERVEHLLSTTDIVFTIFSNCALDFLYLNRYAPFPLGNVVFLFFNKKIQQLYTKFTGLEFLPRLYNRLSIIVDKVEMLQEAIGDACEKRKKYELWWYSKETLPDPGYSINIIYQKILTYLKNGEK